MDEEKFKERNRKIWKKTMRKVVVHATGGEHTPQGIILKRMFKRSDEKTAKKPRN